MKSSSERVGSRRMMRVTGRELELLDVLDDHLAGQVTAREVLVEPVAAADLLDRDQRARRELLDPAITSRGSKVIALTISCGG